MDRYVIKQILGVGPMMGLVSAFTRRGAPLEVQMAPFTALGCKGWNSKFLTCCRVMRKLQDISIKSIGEKSMEMGEALFLS